MDVVHHGFPGRGAVGLFRRTEVIRGSLDEVRPSQAEEGGCGFVGLDEAGVGGIEDHDAIRAVFENGAGAGLAFEKGRFHASLVGDFFFEMSIGLGEFSGAGLDTGLELAVEGALGSAFAPEEDGPAENGEGLMVLKLRTRTTSRVSQRGARRTTRTSSGDRRRRR